MKYEKTDCIVLDACPSGEADKSLLLATAKFGKITAVAAGALKISARLSPALEPFCETEIALCGVPRAFRNKIATASSPCVFRGITSTMQRMLEAAECARVYGALTPYLEPDAAKYALLRRTMELLSRASNPRKISLGFVLRMLKISGYDFTRISPQAAESGIVALAARLISLKGEDLDTEPLDDVRAAALASALGLFIENMTQT